RRRTRGGCSRVMRRRRRTAPSSMRCGTGGSSSRSRRFLIICEVTSTRRDICRTNTCWRGEWRSMAEGDRQYLLTAAQTAQFVLDGYLLFEGFVPQELNEAAYADQVAGNGRWNESASI